MTTGLVIILIRSSVVGNHQVESEPDLSQVFSLCLLLYLLPLLVMIKHYMYD